MKTLLLGTAAACLTVGLAVAQTSGAPPTTNSTAPSVMTPRSVAPNLNSKAAASGDSNQAIVTTAANAAQPAKGSNSFSQGQAQARIRARGFTDVSGLAKDANGVWRGTASKAGQSTGVWLDYKGNVGQQ